MGWSERSNHLSGPALSGGERSAVGDSRGPSPGSRHHRADEPTGNLDETTAVRLSICCLPSSAIAARRWCSSRMIPRWRAPATGCCGCGRGGSREPRYNLRGIRWRDRGRRIDARYPCPGPTIPPRGGRASRLPLVLRLALRECVGPARFRHFPRAVSRSASARDRGRPSLLEARLTEGMAREGRHPSPGGDLAYSLLQREADTDRA